MHGLIFVTWEKYLWERFGSTILSSYRNAIGETPTNAPLVSKVYSDEQMLAGIDVVCRITGLSADIILQEYGRYFMLNGLTNHLCAYLLTRVRSGQELLLIMRNAHDQMRRTPDSITPPLFQYEALSLGNPHEFAVIYDSPRQLCSLLYGAIEGAAERYGESVTIQEVSCMKKGADVCRMELCFSQPEHMRKQETQEQLEKQRTQQLLADLVLSLLPQKDGITLVEISQLLQNHITPFYTIRLSMIWEALRHLQYAGLVASTANLPEETPGQRRYWQAPTVGMLL